MFVRWTLRAAFVFTLLLGVQRISWAQPSAAIVQRRADPAEGESPRTLSKPFFVQMAGSAQLRGRIGGRVVEGVGRRFFETYR